MTKHTPGSWVYLPLREAAERDWIGEIGGYAVLPAYPATNPHAYSRAADARLAAAAPDLLETLREARLDLIDYTAIPEIRAVVFKITEAMIRAEG